MDELVVYSANVKKLTTEIKVIQDNVCHGMIEIGKRLIEVKKEVGHGNWLPYLKDELGYSQTTAKRLMNIADEFDESFAGKVSKLSSSKLVELLAIPSENRDKFVLSINGLDGLSVRLLRDKIKEYNMGLGITNDTTNSIDNLKTSTSERCPVSSNVKFRAKQRKPIPSATMKQLAVRSGGRCEVCGKGNEYLVSWLNVHHIIEHHISQDDSMENLIMVCPDCHGFIHDLKNVSDSSVKDNIAKGIVQLVGENTYNKIKLYI